MNLCLSVSSSYGFFFGPEGEFFTSPGSADPGDKQRLETNEIHPLCQSTPSTLP